jgi:hypothetical protein
MNRWTLQEENSTISTQKGGQGGLPGNIYLVEDFSSNLDKHHTGEDRH